MSITSKYDWTFDEDVFAGGASSLVGYAVIAIDGEIGDVTEESTAVGSSFIVVDTGFWLFEKKRLVPATAVAAVDHDAETIRLEMTKDDVKAAPDYVAESNIMDSGERDPHDLYYRPFFAVRS